jgi:hypothetical protein
MVKYTIVFLKMALVMDWQIVNLALF